MYAAGTVIIRQGNVGEHEFFIIMEGSVVVEEERLISTKTRAGLGAGSRTGSDVGIEIGSEQDGGVGLGIAAITPTDNNNHNHMSKTNDSSMTMMMMSREIVKLATLREGHTFGEMSLIDDEPRVATVTANEGGTVVGVLTKADLITNMSNESFAHIFHQLTQERKIARERRQKRREEAEAAAAVKLLLQGGTKKPPSVPLRVSAINRSSTPHPHTHPSPTSPPHSLYTISLFII